MILKTFYLSFSIFLVLLFVHGSTAQLPEDDEIGCATKESKSLGFLVGKWKVDSKFRTGGSGGKWENTKGVSQITHLFEDCVYQEVLTGKRNDRVHHLTGLFSFNNMSDKIQWVGGHSEHGLLTLYEGGFDGDDLILENELMIRDRTIYFRIVITKAKKGFDVRSERSSDKKSWDAGWFREYRK